MAAATLLPPLRPRAMMYGARAAAMMRSLLISTFTKPTGTPMMSAGAAFDLFRLSGGKADASGLRRF